MLSKYCDLNWKLSMFFVETGKGIIRRTQLRLIFQLIFTIIEERALTALDSTDIIISDLPMKKLTGMPHLHLHQMRQCVLNLITISDEGRCISNPTDSFKVMIRRIFPQQLPTSEGENAAPIQAVSPMQNEVKWTMTASLSIILIGFVSTEPVEFNAILNFLNNYISRNRSRLLHPQNLAVACIRLDPLYTIFNVSYVHYSQLRGYLRDHVNPVAMN